MNASSYILGLVRVGIFMILVSTGNGRGWGDALPGVTQAGAQGPVKVYLEVDAKCAVTIRVEERLVAHLDEVPPLPKWLTTNSVEFARSSDFKTLHIRAMERNVEVHGRADSDWSADILARHRGIFRFDCEHHWVELGNSGVFREGAGSDGNRGTSPGVMSLTLPDSSKVSLKDGATARLDTYKDGSFTLTGIGPVQVMTSDGVLRVLGSSALPFASGPLVQTTNRSGVVTLKRSNPTTEVRLGRNGDQSLQVQWEVSGMAIQPGSDTPVQMPNGSLATVRWDPGLQSVDISVMKGDFRFSVDGVPGWITVLETGQRGRIIWDSKLGLAEFQNQSDSSAPPVQVIFPGKAYATVGFGGRVQIGLTQPGDSRSFTTAAAGGQVLLHTSSGGEPLDLGVTGRTLTEGLIAGGGSIQGVPTGQVAVGKPVSISWEKDGVVDVAGQVGVARLGPGSEKLLSGADGSKLSISQSSGGSVTVTALSGGYVLSPEGAQGFSFQLSEGDVMTLSNPNAGGFVARGGPQNGGQITVLSATGDATSRIPAGSAFTLVPGLGSGVLPGVGNATFTEGAGSSTTGAGTGTTTGGVNGSTGVDVSRIPRSVESPAGSGG